MRRWVRAAESVLVLVSCALQVAIDWWVQPVTWQLPFQAAMAVHLASYLVAPGVPVAAWFALRWRDLRPRGTFVVDERRRRFIVPNVPFLPLFGILFAGMWGSGTVVERRSGTDEAQWTQGTAPFTVAVVLLTLGVLAGLALVQVRRPRLTLDAGGLTIHRLHRVERLAWDDLSPGGPVAPPSGERASGERVSALLLFRAGPPFVPLWLPVGWLRVDPGFLARAVRTYVEEPGTRHTIGTRAGLDELTAAPAASPTP